MTISNTPKKIMSSEQKQQIFRKAMLQIYGAKCLFCGHDDVQAAHLVDCALFKHSDADYYSQYDPYNGIPLCPNCHLSFDKRMTYIQPWNPLMHTMSPTSDYMNLQEDISDSMDVQEDVSDFTNVIVHFTNKQGDLSAKIIEIHRNAYVYLVWREHQTLNSSLTSIVLAEIKRIDHMVLEKIYAKDGSEIILPLLV